MAAEERFEPVNKKVTTQKDEKLEEEQKPKEESPSKNENQIKEEKKSKKCKAKRGLEISLAKFCLHKVLPIPPSDQAQNLESRNLRIKVVQNGRWRFTRSVTEVPIPQSAQMMPNKEADWAQPPNQKLWTKSWWWTKNSNVSITVKLLEYKKRFCKPKRKTLAATHKTVFPCSYPEPGDFIINLAYRDHLPDATLSLSLKNTDDK